MNLNQIKITYIVSALFIALGFQNCSDVEFDSIPSDNSAKVGGTNTLTDNTFDQNQTDDTYSDAENNEVAVPINFDGHIDTGFCGPNSSPAGHEPVSQNGHIIVNDPQAKVYLYGVGNATLNVESAAVNGFGGDIDIQAKGVPFANRIAGSIIIRAEGHVGDVRCIGGDRKVYADSVGLITAGAGSTYVEARRVDAAGTSAGHFEIHADSVGLVTSIAGDMYIKANSIEKLHLGAGTVTILNAEISEVIGVQTGQFCLKDGAKVLSWSDAQNSLYKCF